jgi:hypothetical protein
MKNMNIALLALLTLGTVAKASESGSSDGDSLVEDSLVEVRVSDGNPFAESSGFTGLAILPNPTPVVEGRTDVQKAIERSQRPGWNNTLKRLTEHSRSFDGVQSVQAAAATTTVPPPTTTSRQASKGCKPTTDGFECEVPPCNCTVERDDEQGPAWRKK